MRLRSPGPGRTTLEHSEVDAAGAGIITGMQFRLVTPIAALAAVLIMAAPAWAGTVEVQDDAHVLNTTAVQNDAATLPVGVYIWATTQYADSKSVFDTDVRNKVNATSPIVIGINTQSHHESIQVGSQAGLSQRAALAAESSANGLGKMHGEELQFRRDEMCDHDRGGPSDAGAQGDWVVGQDSDFGDTGDGDQQGSGDW
jgi:hypothetical protein